jgi:hypothetical protein
MATAASLAVIYVTQRKHDNSVTYHSGSTPLQPYKKASDLRTFLHKDAGRPCLQEAGKEKSWTYQSARHIAHLSPVNVLALFCMMCLALSKLKLFLTLTDSVTRALSRSCTEWQFSKVVAYCIRNLLGRLRGSGLDGSSHLMLQRLAMQRFTPDASWGLVLPTRLSTNLLSGAPTVGVENFDSKREGKSLGSRPEAQALDYSSPRSL